MIPLERHAGEDNLSIFVVRFGTRKIFTKLSSFPVSEPMVGAGRQLRSSLGGILLEVKNGRGKGGVRV